MNIKNFAMSRQIRYLYISFIRIRANDVDVARGMALGVFIGFTPTFGFQILLAIGAAFLVGTNRVSALLGVFITNPLTVLPIYTFNYKVGKILIGSETLDGSNFDSISEIVRLGGDLLYALWVGSCAVGLVGAIIAYFVTLVTYKRAREKREARIRSRNAASKSQDYSLGSGFASADLADIKNEFLEGKVQIVKFDTQVTRFRLIENNAIVDVRNDIHLRLVDNPCNLPEVFPVIAPMTAVGIIEGQVPSRCIQKYSMSHYITLREKYETNAPSTASSPASEKIIRSARNEGSKNDQKCI